MRTGEQLSSRLKHSFSLQVRSTSPELSEKLNILKEKTLDAVCPFLSTCTVRSAGLAHLVRNREAPVSDAFMGGVDRT